MDKIGGRWQNRLNKALSLVLIIAILGVGGALVYVITNPKPEEFTIFYILSSDGKAADYPKELKVGEEGRVILDIINRERETVNYRLEVKIEGVTNSAISGIVLGHGEEWKGEIGFTPVKSGENQKVEFVLYKEEKSYRWLHIWINVTR